MMQLYTTLCRQQNMDAGRAKRLPEKRTDIHVYPGPSVAKRLDMAIDIALHTSDDKNPIDESRDRIGSGPAIA